MKRAVLERILTSANGVDPKDGDFVVGDDHHLNFYIGQPGQAMVVSDVELCSLEEELVVLRTREKKTTLWLEYEAVHGVTLRPPRGESSRRAGFS